MGYDPLGSGSANAGGSGVTGRHTRAAGTGVSPIPPDDLKPLGGGGALPKKARFSMESGFRGLSVAAGSMVLVIIVAIAIFLISKAIPALRADNANFLTTKEWFPNDANPRFGIAALAFGTVLSSVLALIVAVPIALGIALFLSHYAPKRLATPLGFAIDLLAAVPSVVFGLWGRDVFLNPVRDFSIWLNHYFSWIPLFGGDGPFGRSIMLGGLVLAIMVLPIVTSLSREVFQQTPAMNEEAALALGATKWEMIRTSVLPYGKPGVIAAVMLGLGRALGETMAVTFVIGNAHKVSASILQPGTTISASIANEFTEAVSDLYTSSLTALGLILFVITFIVLAMARYMLSRIQKREG
jgi:phosphate transport system permease protein